MLAEINNVIPHSTSDEDIQEIVPEHGNYPELFEPQFEPQPGCSQHQSDNDEIDAPVEKKTSFEVTGRRIVDISFLFKQILDSEKHKLFGCDITDMQVIKEVRKGFISTFTLKCKMCGITQQNHSEDPRNISGITESLDINSALILGAVSSGNGYSTLAEISAAINMPVMAENTYSNYHDIVSDVIYSTAKKVMEEAGKEEAELAKNLEEIDENEVPFITVVADGAWSKRSYNVNYNAASSVGCIVGHRTGKLLYLGVRNKFCSTCDFYNRKEVEIPQHKCFKNWIGTSTSMETDIIVEGFRSSITTHGLKYLTLVGDGDSSVYSKLILTKHYGPQTVITKIECSNHLLRNFSSKLRDISKRRRSASTNALVPVYLRKEVENNAKRLRFAISKATKYRIEENADFQTKVKQLKEDILNAPSHVFGEHAKCDEINYFNCNKKGINVVSSMQECGLYRDIQVCMNRLIIHIESLLYNMNNNLAEHYNSIVCKFVGGERINYSKKNPTDPDVKLLLYHSTKDQNIMGSFIKR
nr:uncharacterized protein LOC111516867 [Leptinotarsa decemlineata]